MALKLLHLAWHDHICEPRSQVKLILITSTPYSSHCHLADGTCQSHFLWGTVT